MSENGNGAGSKAIFQVLLEMQSKPPEIYKTGNAAGRYSYIKLPDLLQVLLPVLTRAGCVLTHRTRYEDGMVILGTVLRHVETGSVLHTELPFPVPTKADVTLVTGEGREVQNMSPPQAYGSWITYLRRYSILLLLGITDGLDNDADWMGFESEGSQKAPSVPQAASTPAPRGDGSTDIFEDLWD